MQTIGFLELSSIAKGIQAADILLKAADVELVFAKPVCPGKYSILFTGEVSAVKASLEAGMEIGGNQVVDSIVIARVHPQVIQAIGLGAEPDGIHAVGVMEFFSITAAVYAADAAVKAADVDLIEDWEAALEENLLQLLPVKWLQFRKQSTAVSQQERIKVY